jgi:hypothetical protein
VVVSVSDDTFEVAWQGRRPQPTTPCGWPQEPQPCAAQESSGRKGEPLISKISILLPQNKQRKGGK